VLASGADVNVLVLDTEVYSNTGGQASKATPRGAVAKFAAGGKQTRKKDLGQIASAYGHVYVAQIALGADNVQTVKALAEAEAWNGPSLVIAYSHCIAHGIDMAKGMDQQKRAVDSGYWPLWRYDPRHAGPGEHPFHLDAKAPKIPLSDFTDRETRFAVLARSRPQEAERLAALAREHDFVLASDEAYTELWFDEPPVSALQLDDWTNLVVFNTLSKRSSMTGYRSGFVAGDPTIVAALKQFRPNVGTAPQEFVQRASVVAWGDEEHVQRARAAYAVKRRLFLELFVRVGLRGAGGPATMYLWVATPPGVTSEALATRLLDHGVIVAPGAFLGDSGEGYIRFALVPTLDECRRAIEILEGVL